MWIIAHVRECVNIATYSFTTSTWREFRGANPLFTLKPMDVLLKEPSVNQNGVWAHDRLHTFKRDRVRRYTLFLALDRTQLLTSHHENKRAYNLKKD